MTLGQSENDILKFVKGESKGNIPVEEITRRMICMHGLDKIEIVIRNAELVLELLETGTIKSGAQFGEGWEWVVSIDGLKRTIRRAWLQEIQASDPELLIEPLEQFKGE